MDLPAHFAGAWRHWRKSAAVGGLERVWAMAEQLG